MRANLITDGRQAARAETDYAERLRDPGAQAQGTHGRLSQDRRASQEKVLDRPLSGGFDQIAEHPVPVLATVIAPCPLVQVTLQPLVRDGVVRATDTRLEQAEEAVDGLRVTSPST